MLDALLKALPQNEVERLCATVLERIDKEHIRCFRGSTTPLFLISTTYPGIWLEHVYDAVLLAEMFPRYLPIAVNTVRVFLQKQRPDGQLPCYIWDGAILDLPEEQLVGYGQIQEVVAFSQLALEVARMVDDADFLREVYDGCTKWHGWMCRNRMTSGRGLVEMFCGHDTGHDQSARLEGLSCIGNYIKDGVPQNAAVLPPDDTVPILAVDMNANFYANCRALAEMAMLLGEQEQAEAYAAQAQQVKAALFARCYDPADGFFYDADKHGNHRKYRSCTLFHLFMERVLDPVEDRAVIDRLYTDYIKNPAEFWTAYPFPSMSYSQANARPHADRNCWGYYSQALIALRCTRWMDAYGMRADFDVLCAKWLAAWTKCYEEMPFGQELDPVTGQPTPSSAWYSSCMLLYLYAARRLLGK